MNTLPIDRRTLTCEALSLCRAYVAAGVREEGGNNRGPQVEVFQRAAGGEIGESWCMDFQVACDLKGLANLLKRPYVPATFVAVCQSLQQTLSLYHAVTGSCGEAMQDAKRRGDWIDRNDVTEIKAGWLLLYAWTAQDVQNRVPRHVGRADRDWKRSTLPISSLEGNTGPDGNQSDGDGCYAKSRSFTHVVGVIRTY